MTQHARKISISARIALPLDAVTQKFAFIGISGSGKTYAAAVMVEGMVMARMPVVVVDPVGVWWGLGWSADGKHDGLPVVIFGGRKGALPLEVSMGPAVADFVMESAASVVLDVSDLDDDEQREFVAGFAERLYRLNRSPVHVVLDEADVFGPQQRDRGQRRTIRALNNLVRRGRARGIGVTMITQRPAVLDKDLLTQAEVLFAFRLVGPPDQAAAESWIKHNCSAEERDTFLGSLASLPTGTAWLISPSWLGVFKRIHVSARATFDSSSTPTAAVMATAPPALRDVNLDELRARFAGVLERSRTTDPEGMRLRIEELERLLAARSEQVVPVPVLADDDRKLLSALRDEAGALRARLDAVLQRFGSAVGATEPAPSHPPVKGRPSAGKAPPGAAAPPPRVDASPPARAPSRLDGRSRILATLARFHPATLTRRQLGTLADLVPSGRTFRNYTGEFRSKTLIHGDAVMGLTELGVARARELGLPMGPINTPELQALWKGVLPSGAGRMLELLLGRPRQGYSPAELAETAGYERAGRTFRNYLGLLRSNGLAEDHNGAIRATAWILGTPHA